MKATALGCLAVAFTCYLGAQTYTGGISGTVKDESDAVISGSRLMLTNLDTNERREQLSNSTGFYAFTALPPGRYRLEAESAGFKKFAQEVEVRVQQFVTTSPVLQIGDASQRIEVGAQVALLDAATSSLGQVVENQQITELPLNGRNTLAFVELTPGIRLQNFMGENLATTNWTSWGNFSANGGLANSNEVLVDGAPVTMAELNNVVYLPPVDATQEFRVQTNNYSAEFGRSAGAVVNLSIKSGTNQLHGSVYEFFRNRVLDASDFFQNRAGQKKPALSYNQYGVAVGGPIVRNKTFYFANYEGFRQRQGIAITTTVPTALQRAGDFSNTRNAAGQLIQIGDPLTTRTAADGTLIRSAFGDNRIPASRIDVVAANLTKAVWPLPNTQGQPFTNVNNFATSTSVVSDSDQGVIRVDHSLEKWRFSGTYGHQYFAPGIFDPFQNRTTTIDLGADVKRIQHVVLSATASFSPRLVGEFRSAFVRFHLTRLPASFGFDLTSLGFPRSLADAAQYKAFPYIDVSGVQRLDSTTTSVILRDSNNWTQSASLTWLRGGHTIKTGVQYRILQLNDVQNNIGSPTFTFNERFSSVDPLRATATSGVGLASFLMGYPSGGSIQQVERLADQRWYAVMFVQDDWRATQKLTLNMGLQYSLDSPLTERYDRKAWFDFEATPPTAQKVGLPLRGGMRFADNETRTPADLYLRQWGPRFGFAYQLRPTTVVRGGYGIFWLPNNLQTANTGVNLPSWSLGTPFVSSLDNGITPKDTLSNPFPNGVLQPPGKTQGLDTLVGQGISVYLRDYHSGYTQHWNFNIQQEVANGLAVDIAYAGSRGIGLPVNINVDQLPSEYLSLGNAVNSQVPNPFFGFVQSGTLAQPTVARGQLLRPFPHFTGLTLGGTPAGSSTYHSLQLKVTKRFSASLLTFVYTAAKSIGDSESRTTWLDAQPGGYMDNYNRRLDRSLHGSDAPQRFVAGYNLELPFGRGKKLLSNAGKADRIVSGWELSGIYTLQSGAPLFLSTSSNLTNSFGGGSRPNNSGRSAKLTGDARDRLDRWFDMSVFSQPAPSTFGNTSRTLPDVRNHSINSLDAGIFKNNRFGADARFNLQFRSEFFNMFNRARFGNPGMTFGSPQFGIVSSQANRPRLIQFALKLTF